MSLSKFSQASRLVQKSRSSKRHFHEILDEASLEVIHRVEANYTQEAWLAKTTLHRTHSEC